MTNNLFLSLLKQVKDGRFNLIELVGAAEGLRQTDGAMAVAALYKAWIDLNPDAPLLYAVLFNYGTVLTDSGDLDGAQDALERSLALNPDFTPSRIKLGRIHERKGNSGKSVSEWLAAIDKLATVTGTNVYHKTTALNQAARVLEANNKDAAAEAYLKQSLELDTNQREVIQHYVALRQRECNWPILTAGERITRHVLMKGLSPLSMAVYVDDPLLQLATNAHYNVCDVGAPRTNLMDATIKKVRKDKKKAPLRVGYLSSDLREHAIGFLMSELFGLHDRKKIEVFAYYCGIPSNDKTHARIKASVDHWVPISDIDDATAAQKMVDDGIQILIDVNGYTRDGRPKLLALRPAPIIVNWLGFPGSMGSPYHHYIIADDWIIPPSSEIYYSEKVVRLPCYQPNDRARMIAPVAPTRKEAGLPEKAMVYCCFNGTQKISPETFDRWLTILAHVPGSVLWLLGGAETAQDTLLAYAEKKGIAANRIIFAEKKPNPQHLARYPLADLFLDTAPYGAHTTASDALWMGVPVLTLSGLSFASRVCGSLVRAVGLPEMACTSPKDFIDTAIALGRDPKRLDKIKEKLSKTRGRCTLFNTPLLVKKLEELYSTMWQDFLDDQRPQPDLQNLDVYLEVGATIDPESDTAAATRRPWDPKAYHQYWHDLLAQRHAYRPIPSDARLWHGGQPKRTTSRQSKPMHKGK